MGNEYYLGLDMGTSSIGWAVTDENYNLLRVKGKDLWGVRLFSEAKTASERRVHRTTRRRLQRERARIGYLKELFADEIEKTDSGFYQRLEDSKYFKEDKTEKQPFALFADSGYTDREYYKEYPTIFHLRKELLLSNKPHDVRLVFLAILNMFKHRGHFLNENLGKNETESLSQLYIELRERVSGLFDNTAFPDLGDKTELNALLSSREFSNSKKTERIINVLGLNKKRDKREIEIIKLLCGLKGVISNIFTNYEYDADTKKISISYRDSNLEEELGRVEEILSLEDFELLIFIKKMHDKALLENIMRGEEYLSLARVKLYEKHGMDLERLKKVFKNHARDKYNEMFRVMSNSNYSAYVGSVNSKEKIERRGGKSDEFFAKLYKIIKEMPKDNDTTYILNEIEKETFLPKQIISSNGVIPNQVHKNELERILNNAENYLSFLKERDDTGLTVSEKIIKLFEFQIPYYVGPVFNNQTGNAWSVRKENGKVMPWNFEQKIDVKKSSEEFIIRMVRHCSYINGENVLPKNSLLYERYMVLNELNNLRINGEKITVKLKQNIYNDLFCKGKKVTRKQLEEFLKVKGVVDNNCPYLDITGIDGDFKNNLSNYAKFTAVFGVEILTYEQEKIAEKIIFWSTVYGDSKSFLRERIEDEFGYCLTKAQIKRILGYKFRDWGRLSKALLEMNGCDKETGEIKTIISRMWDDNFIFMELLSNKFTYLEEIEKTASTVEKSLTDIEYEDLEGLYISAPVRRMVWQAVLILKEIYKILGNEPKKIFVEMAREVNAEKERKKSRKMKFLELYNNCGKEGKDWVKEIKDTDEIKFRSKKLYLFYTQQGKCMYTGESIDLDKLFNDNLYDIDHIYPRHFVKDDSLENNLVLVKKEKNAHKSDKYPLDISIQKDRNVLWGMLRKGDFITEEKYKRLIRRDSFTDEEKAAFISRQIVETRQGTKFITDLFKKTFKESEIIYVKAGNVSDFRHKFDFVKCRNVNDFHHAHDAYFNIVVGNTYNVKFTRNPINFIIENKRNPNKNKYHMDKIFDYTVCRNGEVAWNVENNTSIGIVKKMIGRNTPIVTRMNYEEHGGIADQTIYSAKDAAKAKGVGYIPVKSTDTKILDVCKYGGFKKYTGTYFFLVEHTQKGKRVRTLEALPLYLKEKTNTVEKIESYCKANLKYKNPVVKIRRIKMYSLVKIDGFYVYLTGRSRNSLLVTNAVQLIMDEKFVKYIKKISTANERGWTDEHFDNDKEINSVKNIELYNELKEKHLFSIYKKRPNPVGEKLSDWQDKFEGLSVSRQIDVLLQIIKLSNLTNSGADLEQIGGSKKTGVSTVNKNITERNEFKLINESVTGLFRNEINLLTI